MRKVIKVFCLFLAVWCFAGAIVGCKDNVDDDGGNEGGSGFNPYPYDDLSVYMDLPDYKNITLSEKLVTQMVKSEIAYFCHGKGLDTELTDSGAADFDLLSISFEGFIGGEKVEELCESGYSIVLGSGVFYVDGFEDALIGMKKGEEKTVSLKFADDYPGTEYAGKDVTYKVTVGNVWRAPELTDELIKSNTVFETASEYTAWVRKSCIFSYVWDDLLTKCVIKGYPQEYTDYYQRFKQHFEGLAKDKGLTFAEFISQHGGEYADYGLFSGMTVIDFEEVATNYSKSNLVNDLLTYSIIRAEGIETSGAEYEAALKQLEKETGRTYAQLVEASGENDVIISVLNIRLCDVINGYVKIENN